MRRHVKFLFLLAFICFVSVFYAQNTSTFPTKVVNGTEYYVYTVQAGEGLYSISKKFNVSQSEINNANPQIQNGLQAGEIILIPKKGQILQQTQENESSNAEYIIHKVEKKQTIFAISRIYNVSQEDILAANPEAANGIHVGDVLRIPQKVNQDGNTKKSKKEQKEEAKQKKETEKKEESSTNKTEQKPEISSPNAHLHIGKDATFIIYRVQQGETLYSICKRYGVTIDEVVKYNPDAAQGLKAGSELKIPYSSNNQKENNTNTNSTATSTANPNNSTIQVTKPQEKKETYKIAYLLPFMLDEKLQDATVNKFLDFYMGSLLAVKNAQNNSGVNFEIFTYDTEKTESKLYSVINSPEMRKMDLIIGPAYSSQIPILTDFAKRREIYTVIPFSSNVDDINDNPYVFQFNPDKELQSLFIVNALKTKFQNANIIIADIDNNQSQEESDYFSVISNKLNRSNINFTKISKYDLENNNIDKYLVKEKKNIIIFNTYKYSVVQSYLSNLYDMIQKFDLSVIGQYAWKTESGKKPKMYYVAPFKDDEQRKINSSEYESQFTQFYGKLRGEKNPRYDMIGYDITNYFLSLMTKDGFDIEENTRSLKAEGIQSDMLFRRLNRENGGFMNQKLFLIEDAAKRN